MKKYSRDKIKGNFSSICPTAMRRLALIHTEGDNHYGRMNWVNVDDISKFKLDTIDHAMNHLMSYLSGNKEEDHLAKIVWGMNALMHHEDNCKHQETFFGKEKK